MKIIEDNRKSFEPVYGQAKYDYEAVEKDELRFQKGDIMKILSRARDGWFSASFQGKTGLVPGNFLIPMDEETGKYLLEERLKRIF